jgi:3-oxoacyl-[acyl-carrier protein] reductase
VICADLQDCAETLATLRKKGAKTFAHRLDVSSEESVAALFAGLGPLDVLVHCAGIIQEKPLLETSLADFNRVIAVNLTGSFLVGREALANMSAAGTKGRLIMIASDMAYYGRETFSSYVASKHGVLGLVRCWAKEFAPQILVNAICPGPIDTAMLDAANMSAEWREKELRIPLARFGTADEVAALAVFLAGPGGNYFTGQGIGPNGGSIMP